MGSATAHMLACFCVDNLAGFSEDNLPGQPLTSQTAPVLPWDPGSPSPHQQPPSNDKERFNLPRRRGATFEPEPTERRRRSARLPSQDEEEEDEKLTSEVQFRSIPDASALRGTDPMASLASRRPQPRGATGANERLSNAPGLQQGMGQGPGKRPAAKALQPTPGGTMSMASQLKVQYCCCSACSALSLFTRTIGALDCMYCC